ncbi:MAG: winged helix-turn-helix domain-containing protein [Acidobacteriota bacterium]|nr:winged helix-turn-helix domain-containing protein [Acidobacteriota bacterium]
MRVAFDSFAFDSERRELLDGTQAVHLGPQAFRLLEILIANYPRAISKQELYEAIWQGTFVDESNLAGLINELRSALGDQARNPRFIRTVHGFGYAFCCESKGGSSPKPAGSVVFRGQAFPLKEGPNILGRDATADIQIDDTTVSRKHAAITIRENAVTLEDLDSKNGTYLDGAKLTGSASIHDGQTIVLGDASIAFRRSRGGSTLTVSKLRRKK